MTWWQVLGVEPDSDLAAVRQAYARLVRKYRPDEHPERFSAIRAAYEQARHQSTQAIPQTPPSTQLIETTTSVPSTSSIERPQSPQSSAAATADVSVSQCSLDPRNEILERLFQWQASGYRDSTFVDLIVGHASLNEYQWFEKIDSLLLAWIVDHIAAKKGPLATSTNMPHLQLARFDRVFQWTDRELSLPFHPNLQLLMFACNDASGAQARNQQPPRIPIAEGRLRGWSLVGMLGLQYQIARVVYTHGSWLWPVGNIVLVVLIDFTFNSSQWVRAAYRLPMSALDKTTAFQIRHALKKGWLLTRLVFLLTVIVGGNYLLIVALTRLVPLLMEPARPRMTVGFFVLLLVALAFAANRWLYRRAREEFSNKLPG